MKCPAGWEKRLLITLFITLFLFFVTQTTAVALFGPEIVDVTTKAFSVVWTTGPGGYTSCGINLYESDFSTPNSEVEQDQIFIEEDGKPFGIAKVTVVGLDIDTLYYFKLKQSGIVKQVNYTVRTAKLRGLEPTAPNESDIVSNPIVHKAVYQSNGKSPAKGALVLARIYAYNVDPETYPNNTKSYYPISAWVGDGMIGDGDSAYNPNNISYKQYAALNMNNLFEKTSRYPLSLNGDDPDTSTNEAEIIKFTVVHGTQSVLGDGAGDAFSSYGRIEYVGKTNGDQITIPINIENFLFKKGLNNFALPSDLPPKEFGEQYETGDLFKLIKEANGKVLAVWVFENGAWKLTSEEWGQIVDSRPIPLGKGCFVDLEEDMTEEFTVYGAPNSALLFLDRIGLNLVSIPQLPIGYETKDLWIDLEKVTGPDSIQAIWSFENKSWKLTSKEWGQIVDSKSMTNTKFYFVDLKATATFVEGWDPFADTD